MCKTTFLRSSCVPLIKPSCTRTRATSYAEHVARRCHVTPSVPRGLCSHVVGVFVGGAICRGVGVDGRGHSYGRTSRFVSTHTSGFLVQLPVGLTVLCELLQLLTMTPISSYLQQHSPLSCLSLV